MPTMRVRHQDPFTRFGARHPGRNGKPSVVINAGVLQWDWQWSCVGWPFCRLPARTRASWTPCTPTAVATPTTPSSRAPSADRTTTPTTTTSTWRASTTSEPTPKVTTCTSFDFHCECKLKIGSKRFSVGCTPRPISMQNDSLHHFWKFLKNFDRSVSEANVSIIYKQFFFYTWIEIRQIFSFSLFSKIQVSIEPVRITPLICTLVSGLPVQNIESTSIL